MKKSFLKDQLERKCRKVQILKDRITELERVVRFRDAQMERVTDAAERVRQDALEKPPPDHTEALIAGRVELALCQERARHAQDVPGAKKQMIRKIQSDLKLRLLEPGTTNEWQEFAAWLEEYEEENL